MELTKVCVVLLTVIYHSCADRVRTYNFYGQRYTTIQPEEKFNISLLPCFDEDAKVLRNKRFAYDCWSHSCRYEREMRQGCRCDQDCPLFRDCCPDAIVDQSANRSILADMSCITLFDSNHYWMIATCPASYKNRDYIDKCRENSIKDEDPYQVIPVYSSTQKVYFQNRYCAVCNGATSTNDYTPLIVYLGGLLEGCRIPKISSERDLLLDLMTNSKCKLQFAVDSLPPGRPCVPNLISTCSRQYLANLSDSDRKVLQNACEFGPFSPLRLSLIDASFTYNFRNPACLYCSSYLHKDKARCGVAAEAKVMVPLRAILNVSFADDLKPLQTNCKADEVFDFTSVSIYILVVTKQNRGSTEGYSM